MRERPRHDARIGQTLGIALDLDPRRDRGGAEDRKVFRERRRRFPIRAAHAGAGELRGAARHHGAGGVRHAVERRVMHHDDLAIGGHVDIAFRLLDRELRGFAKGAGAVLRPQEEAAAMRGNQGTGHGAASWPDARR